MNFTAIDFETGCGRRDSACAVALVVVNDGRITETCSRLICPPDPEMDFEMINISIHGITPGMVRNEPRFSDIWSDLRPMIENRLVVAHNASFDISVLRAVLNRYDLEHPSFDYACTVQMARKTFPQLPDHRLDTVSAHLDIDLHHHEAESDARASALIALECVKQLSPASPMEILSPKSY